MVNHQFWKAYLALSFQGGKVSLQGVLWCSVWLRYLQTNQSISILYLKYPFSFFAHLRQAIIRGGDHEKTIQIAEVSKFVEEFTKSIAGEGQGISNKRIELTIYKRDCPDLTLVDLPGITRVAVGDQPADIYKQVTELIMQCILLTPNKQ